MKRGIIVLVVVAMFGWAVYEYVASSGDSADNAAVEETEGINDSANEDVNNNDDVEVGLERGNRAPDFELDTLDGDTVRLSDYRGEKVLVNFWATWCPPCRAEMPDLVKFREDEDANILAVNLSESRPDELEEVEPFADEFGINFPVLLDEDSEVSTTYQIQPIPTNFLIDSEGLIHNVAYGAVNYDMLVQEFEKMD